jgi:hypothetical protein
LFKRNEVGEMKDQKENFTKEEAHLNDGRYIIYYDFEKSSVMNGPQPAANSGVGKES